MQKILITVVGAVLTALLIWGASTWNDALVYGSEILPMQQAQEKQTQQLVSIRLLFIKQQLRDVSREIAALEYERDADPDGWSVEDAARLAELERDLAELQADLDSLDDDF